MKKNGCFDHPPWKDYYLPTGAPDLPEYRIPHAWGQACEYRHSGLGKADTGCNGCKHRNQGQDNGN